MKTWMRVMINEGLEFCVRGSDCVEAVKGRKGVCERLCGVRESISVQ